MLSDKRGNGIRRRASAPFSGRQVVGAFALAFALGFGPFATTADAADLLTTRTVERAYEDVRIDLQNAIINQGLTIDLNGHLGDMLKRTAKDVGASKDLYVDAEYFTFCSSRLSRKMMEADAGNAGLCPYTMYLYESLDSKGKVTVGYKAMPMRGGETSQAALKEINDLLQAILDEATE